MCFCQGACFNDRFVHSVYSPQGHDIKTAAFRQVFCSARPYLGLQAEYSYGFPQKCHFFVLGLRQSDSHFRTDQLDGQSGKPCARSEIKHTFCCERQLNGSKEALAEVTSDNLFRRPD